MQRTLQPKEILSCFFYTCLNKIVTAGKNPVSDQSIGELSSKPFMLYEKISKVYGIQPLFFYSFIILNMFTWTAEDINTLIEIIPFQR